MTGRRGPHTLAPGDPTPHPPPPSRCACLLRLGPGQAGAGDCSASRVALLPAEASDGGGRAASLCLPRGRVVSQSGVARGSGARPLRLRTPSSPSPGSRFRCACEKRGSYSSNGGHQSTSSASLDAFRERIKCHRDVQKSSEKAIVLIAENSHSFFSPSLLCLGSNAWELSSLSLTRSLSPAGDTHKN